MFSFGIAGAVAGQRAQAQPAPPPHPLPSGLTSAPGDVRVDLRSVYFRIPNSVVSGLRLQPTIGVRWGLAEGWEIGLDAETVDNAGPGRQGSFSASRTTADSGSGNFLQEWVLQGKHRVRRSLTGRRSTSLVVSLSNGNRSYAFTDTLGVRTTQNRKGVVPMLEVPTTFAGARSTVTLSPAVVFFAEDNVLYLRRPPVPDAGRFGPAFGVSVGASRAIATALTVWSDAFVPLIGRNTVSRRTGLPARAAAYHAGASLEVNTAFTAELYLTNALGPTGALRVVADREYSAIGVGAVIRPSHAANQRARAARRTVGAVTPGYSVSLATAPMLDRGAAVLAVNAGSWGSTQSLRYAIVQDFELGAFYDAVAGTEDESLLGATVRTRFTDQGRGAPFTLVAAASAARSNNVFINLISGRRNEFETLGLHKERIRFGDESDSTGKSYALTYALMLERELSNGVVVRVTPMVGQVQRRGVPIGGLTLGVSARPRPRLDVSAELGAQIRSRGNMLTDSGLKRAVPWALGARWAVLASPARRVELNAMVTNRPGASPFEALRVRAGNSVVAGLGAGITLP